MRAVVGVAIAGSLLAATLVWAVPPMPRKSPEFSILESSPTSGPDKQSLLSAYRGKVVVLAFVSTECSHCQAFSQVLTKLHKELGPRGFQPIAVALNPQAKMLTPGFVKTFNIDFPVGYSDSYEPIRSFLGYSTTDRPKIPLIVVIDRMGMIRAESPPETDPNLQDEGYMRALIIKLLSEPAAKK
jgi:thiol-disulfide isomerase/thioredoxin